MNENEVAGSTHVDRYVSESNGAVGDEAGVDRVEVGVPLHVGDERGHGHDEDDEDGSDDGRVEALVRPELLTDVLGHHAGQHADGAGGQQEHVAHVRPVLAHVRGMAHPLPEISKGRIAVKKP